MSRSGYNEAYTDPKTQHLIKLSNMTDRIGYLLASSEYSASKLLASLFGEIEIEVTKEPENKELRQLQENYVLNYHRFVGNLREGDVHKHFFLIMRYMNQTYFKGFKGAITNKDFEDLANSNSESEDTIPEDGMF